MFCFNHDPCRCDARDIYRTVSTFKVNAQEVHERAKLVLNHVVKFFEVCTRLIESNLESCSNHESKHD